MTARYKSKVAGWLGMAIHFPNQRLAAEEPEFAKLALPSLALFTLSLANVYANIRLTPFPLLLGERVGSRFIVIPFTVVLIMAAVFFQKWLDGRSLKQLRFGIYGSVGLIFVDLSAQSKIWNVRAVGAVFSSVHSKFNLNYLVKCPAPVYTTLLLVGLLVTILTAAFLIIMTLRKRYVLRRAK